MFNEHSLFDVLYFLLRFLDLFFISFYIFLFAFSCLLYLFFDSLNNIIFANDLILNSYLVTFLRFFNYNFYWHFNRHKCLNSFLNLSIDKYLVGNVDRHDLRPKHLNSLLNVDRSLDLYLFNHYLFFNHGHLFDPLDLDIDLDRNLEWNQNVFFDYDRDLH